MGPFTIRVPEKGKRFQDFYNATFYNNIYLKQI
jgi:hypothetical protein